MRIGASDVTAGSYRTTRRRACVPGRPAIDLPRGDNHQACRAATPSRRSSSTHSRRVARQKAQALRRWLAPVGRVYPDPLGGKYGSLLSAGFVAVAGC